MVAAVESMLYRQDEKLSKTPWHGLGVAVKDSAQLSIKEAIETSGLNWKVAKVPLVVMPKSQMIETGATEEQASVFDGCHSKTVDRYANIRMSDKSVLGTVGESYRILQNSDAFEFFQPFLDSEECSIETCGSLFNGAKVWVLAKLNRKDMEISAGDNIRKYLMLSNSHDGTMSTRVTLSGIRTVCWNTTISSIRSKDSASIRVRHSSGAIKSLNAIRDTINTIDAEFEATAEQYRKMLRKSISHNDLRKFVKIVLNTDIHEEESKLSSRTLNKINEVVGLGINGKGNCGKTVFDAINAVTEYTSWRASRNSENRFDSLYFGQLATLNEKAFKLAVEMSA